MYLVKGELTDELQKRYEIRKNEVARILWNMEQAFTPEELKQAESIVWWLQLRDVYHQEPMRYRANPGEPVEAFEERVRIALELEDTFPEHRTGTCANIWLWLMLGANAPDTTEGKPITSYKDTGIGSSTTREKEHE